MMDDDKLVRLTVIPMLKAAHRRQRILLAWVIVLALMSIVSLGVAIATLVEVIR